MAFYKIEFSKEAAKEFTKFDGYTKRMIQSWINKHLTNVENPRLSGKALKGNLKDYWRYRIGDYRMVCEIKDDKLIILVIAIGHRREIYDR
ncbi:MAG: type II toxin-antitoxin system RelE/ParE family toxin [Bacillota bacterium]|nr:type II toxin-antitoxin system RelE/ParE family toxin [Bacillota bacterium]